MAAVDWPTTAELKQRLDITSADWDDQLARLLAAAISETKQRVGDWVEDYDRPDESVSQSALELAVELAQTGEAAASSQQSKSRALLFGKRRRIGIG
jgi:cytosine/adenosine deaminase-related metal-dependent hydrolase